MNHRIAWWQVVAVLAAVLGSAGPAGLMRAQGLAVAAADGHVWLAQPEPARGSAPAGVVIYHGVLDAAGGGRPLQLVRAAALPGELALRDLAAREQSLIVPLRSGVLRRVRAEPGTLPDTWDLDSSVLARLPAGASLRAVATEADEPVWALVRREGVASPAPATALDDAADQQWRRLERVLGLPPGAMAEPPEAAPSLEPEGEPEPKPAPDVSSPAEDPSPEDTAARQDRPADLLLVRASGQWVPVPLPEDWPTGQPAWLVLRDSESDGRPMLATLPPRTTTELWTWRWIGETWRKRVVPFDQPHRRVAGLVEVAGQVVVVTQPTDAQSGVSVAAAVLRRGQLAPIGELRLDVPAGSPWNVAAVGHDLALLAQPTGEPGTLLWTRLTLQGDVLDAEPLPLITPDPMAEAPGMVLQTGVLVLVLALVVLFWRRDAGLQMLRLPRGVMLADLGRRTLGGAIDLVIVLGPVMLGWGYDAQSMYHHWPTSPGPGMTWPGMLPGVIVVVGFVAHTTLAEMFTGRSLGKWLLKMRVANLQGEPATRAQLASRSLLKVFDVIAWLPLVLPLIGPYRQRLGDIVARTVVVVGTKQPEKPRAADEEDDEDEDADAQG